MGIYWKDPTQSPEARQAISDPEIRRVLHLIASRSAVRLKDLFEAAGANAGNALLDAPLRARVQSNLEILKANGLIEEHPAPIRDFNAYNPTPAGLYVDRKLASLGLNDVAWAP